MSGLLYFIASEIIGDLMLMTLLPPMLILLAVYLNFGLAWAIAAAYLGLPVNLLDLLRARRRHQEHRHVPREAGRALGRELVLPAAMDGRLGVPLCRTQ